MASRRKEAYSGGGPGQGGQRAHHRGAAILFHCLHAVGHRPGRRARPARAEGSMVPRGLRAAMASEATPLAEMNDTSAVVGGAQGARPPAPAADGPAPGAAGEEFADVFSRATAQICSVVKGKADEVKLALVCLFAQGHLLVEDVPGVGKTTLAKALAFTLGLSWHRIQFTPDLLPSDITGASIFDRNTSTFTFRPGGIFANVLLADEINRASPKTQAALLEAMEEL